jgi:hypothetical protein
MAAQTLHVSTGRAADITFQQTDKSDRLRPSSRKPNLCDCVYIDLERIPHTLIQHGEP